MTFQKLASLIAKREGKKSQARIGDIREILKILVEVDVEMRLDIERDIDERSPLNSLRARADEKIVKATRKKQK